MAPYNPLLPQTPQIPLVGITGDPTKQQNPDLNWSVPLLGRHGEQLSSEIHGKYYTAAARSNIFLGSTVIAGVALPVNAVNVVSKFTLWNPLGSGVNAELIEFGIGIDSATTVVNGIVAGFQFGVGAATTVPGTLTALTTSIALGGVSSGTTPKSTLYSAATLVNAAVLGPLLPIFGGFGAVTDGALAPDPHKFDGKVVLPPGSLVTFLTTVVVETATFCGLTWAEWPV